jgi:hypothetical protein
MSMRMINFLRMWAGYPGAPVTTPTGRVSQQAGQAVAMGLTYVTVLAMMAAVGVGLLWTGAHLWNAAKDVKLPHVTITIDKR